MRAEVRRRLWRIAGGAVGVFLLVNGFAWTPGYGGRHDRRPGMEVERFFGWPACFRAELWRSDHPHEIEVFEYMPPVPLSGEMSLVYASNAVLPLLLDLALVAAVAAVFALLVWVQAKDRIPRWAIAAGIVLAILSWLILRYADETSAYL